MSIFKDKGDEEFLNDTVENMIRVVAAIVLGIVLLGVGLLSRNIYKYLCRQQKYETILISAFYAILSIVLVTQVFTWTCLIVEPRLFAFLSITQTQSENFEENNQVLIGIFVVATLLIIIFTYAFNWVIVATVQDLSWSICTLSNTISPCSYQRRRKISITITFTASTLFALLVFILPLS